jgi:hypothetical protein
MDRALWVQLIRACRELLLVVVITHSGIYTVHIYQHVTREIEMFLAVQIAVY